MIRQPGIDDLELQRMRRRAKQRKARGASPAQQRQRDLFGGFMDGLYPGRDPADLTKDERGRINRAVKSLPESATREEVTEKARRWQRDHPDLDCSPQAITGNWNKIPYRPPQQPPSHGGPEQIQVQTADGGWALARRLADGTVVSLFDDTPLDLAEGQA